VAGEFQISYDALTRHHRNHARRQVVPAIPEATVDDPLDELVAALRVRALAGHPSDTREDRLDLAAQADVRHAAPPRTDLAAEPEWQVLRSRLLAALEPYPEARLAAAAVLEGPG
jgi:hypothetical protein